MNVTRIDEVVNTLLDTGNEALITFTKRNLLEEEADIEELWASARAEKILRKQQTNGSWIYPNKKATLRSSTNFNQYQTYKTIAELVEIVPDNLGNGYISRFEQENVFGFYLEDSTQNFVLLLYSPTANEWTRKVLGYEPLVYGSFRNYIYWVDPEGDINIFNGITNSEQKLFFGKYFIFFTHNIGLNFSLTGNENTYILILVLSNTLLLLISLSSIISKMNENVISQRKRILIILNLFMISSSCEPQNLYFSSYPLIS